MLREHHWGGGRGVNPGATTKVFKSTTSATCVAAGGRGGVTPGAKTKVFKSATSATSLGVGSSQVQQV